MTATMPETKDLERRAGVDSLEALHAERRDVVKEIGSLELLFGSGGDRWASTRHRHRDGVAKLIREEIHERWRNGGTKGEWKEPSEAMLTRMANSDPRHTDFVDETESAFPRWLSLKTALDEIGEKIRSREIELTVYNSELRMAR